MPPRGYIVLTSLFVLLLWLIVAQQNELSFTHAIAQSEPAITSADAAAVSAPSDLNITLVAINDGPKYTGEQVTLSAVVTQGDPTGLNFYWNFGDGQTGQGAVVTHRYADSGIYTAFVIATDGMYSERAATKVVIMQIPKTPPEPIEGLDATSDSPTIAGNPTNFLATIQRGSNVTFEWDFGDGSASAKGVSVSHIYQRPGDFVVTVRASNPYGPSQVKQFMVWIFEAPPRGLRIAYAPQTVILNQEIVFTATVESGTNVVFDWALSDGNLYKNQAVIRHRITSIGPHEVRARASNSAGELFTTVTLLVQDEPPVILRVLYDDPKPANQPVQFEAFILSNSAVQSEWSWGDGKSETYFSDPDQDGIAVKVIEPTHAYATQGRYLATLGVFSSGGNDTTDMRVYIDKAPAQNTTSIAYTPELPRVGERITYTVPLDPTQVKCTWEFGEGTERPGTITDSFMYNMSKKYIVYVQCTTLDGTKSYNAEIVVYIRGNFFLPIIARHASFVQQPAGGLGEPGDESTVTPTPTETPTPTATVTPEPTFIEVPTFTLTPSETPAAIPIETMTPTATSTTIVVETPTATATEVIGGTIPQPTATTEEPGGTIPQP